MPVSFSAPQKLLGLCKKVNNTQETQEGKICKIGYRPSFVQCDVAVVYSLPLTCGKQYIGQTSRCVNTRLREHRYNCQQITHPGNLATHCNQCACVPQFEKKTTIVKRIKDNRERIVYEAAVMASLGAETCVSEPSIKLFPAEIDFVMDVT